MPYLQTQGQLFMKLCSDHLSYEAIPRKPMKVGLAKLKKEDSGRYELLMWTPHFVVMRTSSGLEVTVRGDGRMVVRKAASEEDARNTATEIMHILLEK